MFDTSGHATPEYCQDGLVFNPVAMFYISGQATPVPEFS
jgi:hypothetical protein